MKKMMLIIAYFAATVVFISCKKDDYKDRDVYIAGSDGHIATIWKNGVMQYLTDGNSETFATALYVSGNDVYVAGDKKSTRNGARIAVVWKNGVEQNLTDGNYPSYAVSVFVVEK